MRRTLQTALNLFKEHPHKLNIKFIVMPYICEIIGDLSDIQIDTRSVIDHFTYAF